MRQWPLVLNLGPSSLERKRERRRREGKGGENEGKGGKTEK